MKAKLALLLALCSIPLVAQNPVDAFSSSKLKELAAKLSAEAKKKGGSSFETLTRYGNHYTMMAYRDRTGSSELHVKDADVFMILDGDATIVTGGKMVKAKTTQPNELRGTGIDGGSTQKLGPGDIIHIQPNTPHQLKLAPGHSITYFVVKVTQ